MTSAQTMLKLPARAVVRALAMLLIALLAGLAPSGCAAKPDLVPPGVVVSPYAADAAFAVIPLRNESGASFIDTDAVSDKVVAELAQARGLRCLPLNRTIEAMRALELPAVTTPIEAQQVARAMGVDGIIVGTITAFDPYNPPVFGVSLALYAQPSLGGGGGGTVGRSEAAVVPGDGRGIHRGLVERAHRGRECSPRCAQPRRAACDEAVRGRTERKRDGTRLAGVHREHGSVHAVRCARGGPGPARSRVAQAREARARNKLAAPSVSPGAWPVYEESTAHDRRLKN